jgi:hypothetical protein
MYLLPVKSLQALTAWVFTREVLLKGKALYSWPLCTNKFRSATFYTENFIDLLYKTCHLKEEVNCTKHFPSVSIPWFSYSFLLIKVPSISTYIRDK